MRPIMVIVMIVVMMIVMMIVRMPGLAAVQFAFEFFVLSHTVRFNDDRLSSWSAHPRCEHDFLPLVSCRVPTGLAGPSSPC